MGVSDLPLGPTVRRVAAYLKAMAKATLEPICKKKIKVDQKYSKYQYRFRCTYNAAAGNANTA